MMCVLSLAFSLAMIAGPACAQQNLYGQGQQPPPISAPVVIPGHQGGGGATLELPSSGVVHQNQTNIPPPQPPQQDLVIPTRQLRDQPGYQQVTVTVTQPNAFGCVTV